MKALGYFLCVLLFTACGSNSSTPPPEDTLLTAEVKDHWVRPTDCRGNIKKVVCVVDPLEDYNVITDTRTCLGEEDQYIPEFEKLYDNYPPAFQKMFCSLRKLYIEKDFYATAYAATTKLSDGSKAQGVIMGFRKMILDQKMSYSIWASWKEQLNFGGSNSSYGVSPSLPQYSFDTPIDVNDFLYVVTAHEFGHFFDSANGVNVFDPECIKKNGGKSVTCPPTSSWSKMSWKTRSTPLVEHNYIYRDDLCFYQCKSAISVQKADDLYSGLGNTNYISTYASTNPGDDFAEAISIWAADRYLNASVSVGTATYRFDIITHLNSARMKTKVDYIESLFASPSLLYP